MCSESRRLEEQIKLIESQLKQLPDGKLICKRNDKRYKWYYNKDGKQIYIPKKERKFAEKLAARKYLEHLHEDLLHEKIIHDLPIGLYIHVYLCPNPTSVDYSRRFY